LFIISGCKVTKKKQIIILFCFFLERFIFFILFFRLFQSHEKDDMNFFNLSSCFVHPGCYGLPHALLEGKAKGAVAAVTAVAGQLLG
jgi:hypothetical protein